MLMIPKTIYAGYINRMKTDGVSVEMHQEYLKWLRYYLDFCARYVVVHDETERLHLFIEKLRQKRQSDMQCQVAAKAVTLYFQMGELQTKQATPTEESTPQYPVDSASAGQKTEIIHRPSQYIEAGYQEKSSSPEWDELIGKLADEIKVRHYSRKTLKTYANWSRQFQRFLKNKPPSEISTEDVKAYLTFLAVKCHVASTTQNQAFNSLLFLFRHALKRDFGELRDVPRAKKSLYVPVVLSREEIDAIISHLYHPYSLIVKLLFGCGLRLFECLQLRVRDFNFDAGILTIHGKGKKDRTVPLPESLLPELRNQMKKVTEIHGRDLTDGYDGVFLDDAVEKKFPKAPKELIHQWFLPQRALTLMEETGQRRRWHVHESKLQKALYLAVRKAEIPKRVTAHTFRHYAEFRIMPSSCMTSLFSFCKLFTTRICHSA